MSDRHSSRPLRRTHRKPTRPECARDTTYTNLFTGVHGSYLRGSVESAGLDPDNLPTADPTAMDFGFGGNTGAKAWRHILGCGQGIGAIDRGLGAGELVEKFAHEYHQALAALPRIRAVDQQASVPVT